MTIKRNQIYIVAGAALLLIPYRSVVVPDWRLTVVDHSNTPIPGVVVVQTWQHYTLESNAHYETQTSDSRGVVVFPQQTKWGSVLMRILGVLRNIRETGIHSSFGASAWVVPRTQACVRESGLYIPGEPLQATITIGGELPCKLDALTHEKDSSNER